MAGRRRQVLLRGLCRPLPSRRGGIHRDFDYLFVNDEIGGKGIRCDLSETKASSSVSVDGDRVSFELPRAFERALGIVAEFEGPGCAATDRDLFKDIWEKVPSRG